MSGQILLLAAGGAVSLLGTALFLLLGRRDRGFRSRLDRVAAPLAAAAAGAEDGADTDIFRPAEGGSRLGGVRRFLESRYPLLDAGRVLPRAAAAGLLAAGGVWFSMWFLRMPDGWWTMPLACTGGAAAMWYAMSWMQARRAGEFSRQFPEIVDQIVRLSAAGVPPLEAIAVVAEDAREPVKPVLRNVCDGLTGGLDADTALVAVARRVRLAEFTLFTAVIRLQRRAGGGVSSAFANLSATLRARRSTALKARASTAQTRLTLLVLAVMPGIVLAAQYFISRESVEILFDPERGALLLRIGVGLIVFGLLAARALAARVEK